MRYSRAVAGHPALPYMLLLPTFAIGAAVLIYPLVNGLVLSFTSFRLFDPRYAWVGLDNYLRNFRSPVYWEIFSNSITIVFSAVFFQLVFGLTVALALNQPIRGRGLFRGLIFLIWIIPEIVVALLWMIMFNSDFGILNFVLREVGVVSEFVNWLGDPIPAKLSLVIVYAWRGIPFFMVMILAALQTVPTAVVDAAKIDGASASQRFWNIVMPYIREIVILCCLLSSVRLFQDVTQIFILTNGGPIYSTTTLAIQVYKQAFVAYQIGDAAAVGVTWLVFLFMLAILYIRLVTKGGLER